MMIQDCQDQLSRLYERLWPQRGHASAGNAGQWSTGLSVEEVIARATLGHRGEQFRALFYAGDTSAQGGDESKADSALCHLVLYWTGPDSELANAVFRLSALNRSKWESKRGATTYGLTTIAKAIEARDPENYYKRQSRRAELFTIHSKNGFLDLPEVDWLVWRTLIERGFVVLFGEPGSGKSYVALDLAFHIALAKAWAARGVKGGPVLYITAEGAAMFGKRIRAVELHRGWESQGQLFIMADAPQIMDPQHVELICTAIRELGIKPVLIVVDTLGRTFVGGEENSARDMGQYVAGCDALREATGAAVMVLHHSNKQDGKLRGSTALAGAADTVLKAELSGGTIELTCSKQKDAERFEPLYFAAKPVDVGGGETALVLELTAEPPGYRDAQGPQSPRHAMRVLAALSSINGGQNVPHMDWRRACSEGGIQQTAFNRSRDYLVGSGQVLRQEKARNRVLYSLANSSKFDDLLNDSDVPDGTP